MSVRNPGRRAFLYGAPAVAAGAVLLGGGTGAEAAVTVTGAASPKDYGAKGDGVTDDTGAVTACLRANRVIDFGGPENTYLITSPVPVDRADPQLLFGSGAVLKAGSTAGLMGVARAGHTISGLVFDGGGQQFGVAVRVLGDAVGVSIDGCTFNAIGASGVSVDRGADRARITECSFRRCGHGTAFPPGNDNKRNSVLIAADFGTVADNEILECNWGVYFRADDDDAEGVSFYTCQGNTITALNNSIDGAQGISNNRGRSGRIQDNIIVGFNDNSIDCWGCSNLTISGNTTGGGNTGVFIGDASSGSITITGNVFRGPVVGVRVATDGQKTGNLVSGVTISGNTVSGASLYGILVNETAGNTLTGVTIADNDLNIGDAGDYGIRIEAAECCRVTGNRIHRPRKHGISLSGTDIVDVSGNLIQDASRANAIADPPVAAQYDAINVDGAQRAVIRDNTVYGGARYAVTVTGGTGMTIAGNRWRSSGGLNIAAATVSPIQSDNVQM
ncbi:right-handed parallel beta-helix repeat-containing protein [Actinoplanes sp. NPDC049265]|uniref:right-handed parallel beta-helix repeat-containing protein n=1 Tax=Actinoplanes sp. NPDC049265 TaxID=3363902 RepID=UPI003721C9F5